MLTATTQATTASAILPNTADMTERELRVAGPIAFAQAAVTAKRMGAARYWLDVALETATCHGMGATARAIEEALRMLGGGGIGGDTGGSGHEAAH